MARGSYIIIILGEILHLEGCLKIMAGGGRNHE